MRRVIITDAAESDLRSTNRYIAAQSGRAIADAFYDKILARFARLATLPGTLGTARPDLAPDLRSTPYQNYILYFRYTEDALEIVNVLDARRDTLAHFSQSDPET